MQAMMRNNNIPQQQRQQQRRRRRRQKTQSSRERNTTRSLFNYHHHDGSSSFSSSSWWRGLGYYYYVVLVFAIGIGFTAIVVPFLLHAQINSNNNNNYYNNNYINSKYNKGNDKNSQFVSLWDNLHLHQRVSRLTSITTTTAGRSNNSSRYTAADTISEKEKIIENIPKQNISDEIIKATDDAEIAILNFFHGESRALKDGIIIPFGGGEGGGGGGDENHNGFDNNNINKDNNIDPSSPFYNNNNNKNKNRILSNRLAKRILDCYYKTNNIHHDESIPDDFSPHFFRKNNMDRTTINSKENNNNDDRNNHCTLRIVFVGSAQTLGRDNFHNQSFPFWVEKRLYPIAKAAGLTLQIQNHAMDSDLSREGPQTNHMCIANLVGGEGEGEGQRGRDPTGRGMTSQATGTGTNLDTNATKNDTSKTIHNNVLPVDVIGWDFDGNMQANPSSQVEAFIRWASVLQPAMILINRGGPHVQSRRGEQRVVVKLSPGHNAIVYEDNNIPQLREEPYQNSSDWGSRWNNKRNSFWLKLFHKYSHIMDFAGIDPVGSIWHLDHLKEFSNAAFDAEKALPLFDCGSPGHDPPCNQIPKFIHNHLAQANISNTSLLPLNDTGGAFCAVLFGCRHNWYGGTRSHALRGELNALPIVTAFRHAAKIIQKIISSSALSSSSSSRTTALSLLNFNNNIGLIGTKQPIMISNNSTTLSFLPPPEYCSNEFCNRIPTCITSYIPNLGMSLEEAIRPTKYYNEPIERLPVMGAAHYLNKASVQIKDLDKRFRPMGYMDRKFGYRLAVDSDAESDADRQQQDKKKKKKTKKNNDEEMTDVPFADVAFFTNNDDGLLVLCEPPCFIDECSKQRKMPMIDFVVLTLDGNIISPIIPKTTSTTSKEKAKQEQRRQQQDSTLPHAIEVGGKFCTVVAKSVSKGQHILNISTNVTAPEYVMFSHLISFS